MPNIRESESERIRKKKRADYMRARGRRLGAKPLKGTKFTCEICKLSLPRVSLWQRWCSSCKKIAMIERDRLRNLRLGSIPIGTRQKCKNCSDEFIKIFKRQFYCSKCTGLSSAEALPHQIEHRRKRSREMQRRRRRTNAKWAIIARISAGIRNSLKNGKNGRSWEKLVGYTITDLMDHLERRFLPGMNWENRGLWHIDHIRPLASFLFKSAAHTDFKKAWSLKNLQPLWAVDNIRKSARLDWHKGRDNGQDEGSQIVDRRRRTSERRPGIQCGKRISRKGSRSSRSGASSADHPAQAVATPKHRINT